MEMYVIIDIRKDNLVFIYVPIAKTLFFKHVLSNLKIPHPD